MSVTRFRHIGTLFGGWKVHWNLHLFYWVNVHGRKRNENMAPTAPVWSTMMKVDGKWRIPFHEDSVSHVDTYGLGHKWMRDNHLIAPKVILESQELASLGGHRCHGHEYSHERTSTTDRRDTFDEVDIKWRAEDKKNVARYVLHRQVPDPKRHLGISRYKHRRIDPFSSRCS